MDYLQHFSHDHMLFPINLDEQEEEINCQACERLIREPNFHGCSLCEYYLHKNCMNTPRSIHHPSHPSHPLTLLPKPTYSSRYFTCDACNSEGNSFSLSCAACEFDLHIHCANLPSKVLVDGHEHELELTFGCRHLDENATFVCDVCEGTVDHNFWVYYCQTCDFGTHLDCAVYDNKQELYQRSSKEEGGEEEENEQEEEEEEEEGEEEEEEDREEEDKGEGSIDSLIKARSDLELAKLRLQLSYQQAQMISDFGKSMVNLIG